MLTEAEQCVTANYKMDTGEEGKFPLTALTLWRKRDGFLLVDLNASSWPHFHGRQKKTRPTNVRVWPVTRAASTLASTRVDWSVWPYSIDLLAFSLLASQVSRKPVMQLTN